MTPFTLLTTVAVLWWCAFYGIDARHKGIYACLCVSVSYNGIRQVERVERVCGDCRGNTSYRFLPSDCERVESDDNERVVGGSEVYPRNRYPYMVSLVKYGVSVCGGSLLAPNVVLTAAHCKGHIDEVRIGLYDIGRGSTDRYESFSFTHTVHPYYRRRATSDYDFMLLKLNGSSSYPPVPILDPMHAELAPSTPMAVIGWGTTRYGGKRSQTLLEARVDHVPYQDCAAAYGAGALTDSMLCADGGGADACQGDSGGPLIIKGADATSDRLVGVVSWGWGCACAGYPGVYADIRRVYNWLGNTALSLAGNS